MLSSDVRLFTWVDVEEVIHAKFEDTGCPDFIVSVRAYWDGVFIGIKLGHKIEAIDWINTIF